ncbi:MAG: thiamine pyrophosphate-dependent dehydrogenase E1 component subunit alpha [Chloroflexota bacterium]|nr:thiamine pyrophosphate-dependent dehydrogenase E1 component subunit alpha [Chloroflexota bacterium]MDE2885267.1 thiamine pyrophosphate-dependent dehydrogenase E1 component subunit alpha [Chloroflexota bacterium]
MTTAGPAVDTLKDALHRMMLIRRVEEQVIDLATSFDDLIRGHYHVYIGQEATGVGACMALGPDDYMFTTHRNHGHVIARGGEPGPVIAEIIGRTTGYNMGRGGTFHVIAKHLGVLQTSAVVAGGVPMAAGAAFSIKRRGTDQVSLVFFGDGVLEEGAFHEALNMSSLWNLPLIMMCENNSVHPEGRRQGEQPSSSFAATQLADVARAMNVETHVVDGGDAREVAALLTGLVGRTREGEGPFFIESRLTRWPGNRGQFPELIGGPHQMAWTWDPGTADERLQDWLANADPVSLLCRSLVEEGAMTRAEVEEIDATARQEAEEAREFALSSPIPSPESAMDHIFA